MRARLTAMAIAAALAPAGACFAQSASAPSGEVWDAVQRAELLDTLKRAAPCSSGAEPFLRSRMDGSDTPALARYQVLTDLSFTNDACAPVREAALTLASELAVAAEYSGERAQAQRAAVVASIVSEAFDEADLRTAQLSFEVGPPPRNITRGRVSGF